MTVWKKIWQNLRKKIKVTLVNNIKDNKKYVNRPTFVSQKIFNKKIVAIHEIKPVLTLDKPVYIGFGILHLGKSLMYKFHYEYIGRKYYNKAKLLLTDTDSLIYVIETNDVYEDFCDNKICLILVIIQSFLILSIKTWLVKWKISRRKNNKWICWIKVKNVFVSCCCRWWRN